MEGGQEGNDGGTANHAHLGSRSTWPTRWWSGAGHRRSALRRPRLQRILSCLRLEAATPLVGERWSCLRPEPSRCWLGSPRCRDPPSARRPPLRLGAAAGYPPPPPASVQVGETGEGTTETSQHKWVGSTCRGILPLERVFYLGKNKVMLENHHIKTGTSVIKRNRQPTAGEWQFVMKIYTFLWHKVQCCHK